MITSINPQMRLDGNRGSVSSIEGQHLAVVAGIKGPGQNQLLLIANTLHPPSLEFCARQRRQKQRRQNGDNRDDDEKLDERECVGRSSGGAPQTAAGR